VDSLFDGVTDCIGNVATMGTVGITPENSAPYEYNPELARQLLDEAGYDSSNEIIIYVRGGRFYRNTEVAEATQGYWSLVGVNSSVRVVETAQWREISRSGPGQYSDNPLDAPNRPPPQPVAASLHVYQNFPSVEALDYEKTAVGTLSCYATSSKVCQPDTIEPLIGPAVAATGEERRRLMEELANIVHDDVLFIPYFEATMIYGLNEKLNFEPRYDRRVRLNMLSFAE
jgi:ABC-type transport system substrate-binding protein